MRRLMIGIALVHLVFGCSGGRSPESDSIKPPVKSEDSRPQVEPECVVNIDETSLKLAAISWMRVARRCGANSI